VIFLDADKEAFEQRRARRGKIRGGKLEYAASALVDQSHALKKVYRPHDNSVFDTSKTVEGDTAQQVARMILLDGYEPFEFERRLDEVLRSGGKV
jgi:hypothetical protein